MHLRAGRRLAVLSSHGIRISRFFSHDGRSSRGEGLLSSRRPRFARWPVARDRLCRAVLEIRSLSGRQVADVIVTPNIPAVLETRSRQTSCLSLPHNIAAVPWRVGDTQLVRQTSYLCNRYPQHTGCAGDTQPADKLLIVTPQHSSCAVACWRYAACPADKLLIVYPNIPAVPWRLVRVCHLAASERDAGRSCPSPSWPSEPDVPRRDTGQSCDPGPSCQSLSRPSRRSLFGV